MVPVPRKEQVLPQGTLSPGVGESKKKKKKNYVREKIEFLCHSFIVARSLKRWKEEKNMLISYD